MKKLLPDISDFYDRDDNAMKAETGWILEGKQKQEADFLKKRMTENGCESLLEFGPSSCIMAEKLLTAMPHVRYLGVDKASSFKPFAERRLAHVKAQTQYVQGDIRDLAIDEKSRFDCVTAWAFIKHFNLDEIDKVLARMLSFADYAAFDMQLLDHDEDNGEFHYHHSYITEERLAVVVAAAGHRVVETEVWWRGDLLNHGEMRAVAVWTEKV